MSAEDFSIQFAEVLVGLLSIYVSFRTWGSDKNFYISSIIRSMKESGLKRFTWSYWYIPYFVILFLILIGLSKYMAVTYKGPFLLYLLEFMLLVFLIYGGIAAWLSLRDHEKAVDKSNLVLGIISLILLGIGLVTLWIECFAISIDLFANYLFSVLPSLGPDTAGILAIIFYISLVIVYFGVSLLLITTSIRQVLVSLANSSLNTNQFIITKLNGRELASQNAKEAIYPTVKLLSSGGVRADYENKLVLIPWKSIRTLELKPLKRKH